ncbi:Enoyl-CoA delta isomerase 2, mitochondrial [Orchesella cincta]|uniref:Enoyl-CoA delta isomerase 2, mitochondrial n=1 Tax=Orchesella cincta TaxID=48709 RepID=A0A1D2MV16_ORCCI|nr:Enoyl-CoA delta isomerase 2, mitochondrial [Orchesella cincta]
MSSESQEFLCSFIVNGRLSTRHFSLSSNLQTDNVLFSVENGVRKIVFNRPETKNALRFDMVEKLGNALFESNSDSATKLVTLTGTGDYFTSGNDFSNWDTTHQTIAEMKEKSRKSVLKQLVLGLIECKKPIIALVNGPAIGAGATVVPYCDQTFASDKVYFSTPFTAIGVVPEFCSSYLFPKIMGYSKPLMKAKELIRGPEREKLKQLAAYEMDRINLV